jgi:Predicted DNA-binding protein containing a Zn-ribbon domain
MNTYLIGIDDTDNLQSRGTGYRARQMGLSLQQAGWGELLGITRHQLLVHPDIPYTSHNSSACLEVKSDKLAGLTSFCRDFLLHESAEGSDAGLCIACLDRIDEEVMQWGEKARKEVLKKENAHLLAEKHGIFLQGLTGMRIGVIGSLAAIGLQKAGNDGRYLWLSGMRELTGIHSVKELLTLLRIESIETKQGIAVSVDDTIDVGEWFRPIRKNKKITLIVEKNDTDGKSDWKMASKEYIKSVT